MSDASAFDSVVSDESGYVRRVDVKAQDYESLWIWGAVVTTGAAFRDLKLLWESRHREGRIPGIPAECVYRRWELSAGVARGRSVYGCGHAAGLSRGAGLSEGAKSIHARTAPGRLNLIDVDESNERA